MTIRRAALMLSATLLAACGGAADPPPGTLEVRRAWARATAPGQDVGGVFLEVKNGAGRDDRLLGGSTPAGRAVEIHSTTIDAGVMRMRRQSSLAIPASDSITLKPGATHLMVVGLGAPLTAGQSFDLTLDFANAGKKTVEVDIRPIGSSGPKEASDD